MSNHIESNKKIIIVNLRAWDESQQIINLESNLKWIWSVITYSNWI